MNNQNHKVKLTQPQQYGSIPGRIQKGGVKKGRAFVTIYSVSGLKWSDHTIYPNKKIGVTFDVIAHKGAGQTLVSFYLHDENTSVLLETKKADIKANRVKLEYELNANTLNKIVSNGCKTPFIYFTVYKINKQLVKSTSIPLKANITVKLIESTGIAVQKEPVEVKCPNGLIIKGITDSSGMAEFNDLPYGLFFVRFPNSPKITNAQKNEIIELGSDNVWHCVKLTDKFLCTFYRPAAYIYCEHSFDNKQRLVVAKDLFEIVPDKPDDNNKGYWRETVKILTSHKYSLTCSDNPTFKQGSPEYGMNSYELVCRQKKIIPLIWKSSFWKSITMPQTSTIEGLPNPLKVNSYVGDLYKLQIEFPELKKISGGVKIEDTHIPGKMLKSIKPDFSKIKQSVEKAKTEKNDWKYNKNFPLPIPTSLPIAIAINNVEVEINLIKLINSFITLIKSIRSIIEDIKKLPKCGWYFDFEIQCMQGTFVVEWGWKEYKDNRAFYYVGLNIDVTILSIDLELGIGVEYSIFEIQVYGSIKGSINVSRKLCRTSPDELECAVIPFEASIEGSLGARFTVGYIVRLEGEVVTGFSFKRGEISFNTSSGIKIQSTVSWTGLQAKITASAGIENKEGLDHEETVKYGQEWELVKPRELTIFQFPKEEKEEETTNPPILTKEELHELLVKELKKKNIKVILETTDNRKEYMPVDDIAKEIENVIHNKSRNIVPEKKVMEALVIDIVHNLYLLNKNSSDKKIRYSQFFNQFISNKLPGILKKYRDPLVELINKYGGAN